MRWAKRQGIGGGAVRPRGSGDFSEHLVTLRGNRAVGFNEAVRISDGASEKEDARTRQESTGIVLANKKERKTAGTSWTSRRPSGARFSRVSGGPRVSRQREKEQKAPVSQRARTFSKED